MRWRPRWPYEASRATTGGSIRARVGACPSARSGGARSGRGLLLGPRLCPDQIIDLGGELVGFAVVGTANAIVNVSPPLCFQIERDCRSNERATTPTTRLGVRVDLAKGAGRRSTPEQPRATMWCTSNIILDGSRATPDQADRDALAFQTPAVRENRGEGVQVDVCTTIS